MKSTIWVVDDDHSISWVMDKALAKQGYLTRVFNNGNDLLQSLKSSQPDLVISDIHMPGINGFELIERIHRACPDMPVIIMTAFGDLDSAVDSFKYGAYEYLTKPFDIDELVALCAKAVSSSDANENRSDRKHAGSNSFLGDSPAMHEVFRVIGRIARSSMGVLIRGESGAGKELVAQALHQNSLRADKTFVAINTAAIPSELLESELFGHEKGAFTGANSQHIGRFEQADGATLFLDEIGDMPIGLQTRLLRVLSEGRFYRVGGRREIEVDVRIIAATNQNLEKLVEDGRFRNDLFHRLNVLSVNIPPLRDRVSDIPQLMSYFLDQSADSENTPVKHVSPEVLIALQSYNWPGNVRELQNVVQQLSILSSGGTIDVSDLPEYILASPGTEMIDSWQKSLEKLVERKLKQGETAIARPLDQEFEKILIKAALKHTRGHKQKAARLLGWGRNTLARKIG
jgi:two-component system nitrogen regulation response regulator GlnG